MSRVSQLRLGQAARVLSGYAFKSETFASQGVPVIKIGNIGDGNVLLGPDDTEYVPLAAADVIDQKYSVKRGNILMSLTGSHMTHPRSVVGRVAQYQESFTSVLNQRAGKVTVTDARKLNNDYLYYLLSAPASKQAVALMAHGAANQANVSPRDVEKIKFNVLRIEEQQKVGWILNAYGRLIRNNRHRVSLLEKLAEQLYREWFVRFRFPGHQNVEKIHGVPADWSVGPLGSYARSIVQKYVADSDSALPLVDLEKMAARTLAITELGHADELSTSRIVFAPGDILFSTIRPYLYKVNMAPFHGITNTSVLVLRASRDVLRPFLTVTLFIKDTIAWADQYSSGTKMPVISWNVFRKMPIRLPKDDLLERFNTFVSPMLDQIKTLSLGIIELTEARDRLLPRLISGKLSVENLDIHIPPSMAEELKA